MLRITAYPGESSVTLMLEGQIASDWTAELERECLVVLRQNKRLILDFASVLFIDRSGVEMLKRVGKSQVEIVNTSDFLATLLHGAG